MFLLLFAVRFGSFFCRAQRTVRAFEQLTSEEQRSKFHKWIDSNRDAVALLDESSTPAAAPPSPRAPDGTASYDNNAASTATPAKASYRGLTLDTGVGLPPSSERGAGSAEERVAMALAPRDRRYAAEWAGGGGASRAGLRAGKASPLFRFHGHDNTVGGGEDGAEVGEGRARAASSLAMDQSP